MLVPGEFPTATRGSPTPSSAEWRRIPPPDTDVSRRLVGATMTAPRYFTVDSVVQPVQPAASTAATTTAVDSSESAGRGGIVQVVAGYNRDRDQTATTTASPSQLQPAADLHRPTSVHHLPVSTYTHGASRVQLIHGHPVTLVAGG